MNHHSGHPRPSLFDLIFNPAREPEFQALLKPGHALDTIKQAEPAPEHGAPRSTDPDHLARVVAHADQYRRSRQPALLYALACALMVAVAMSVLILTGHAAHHLVFLGVICSAAATYHLAGRIESLDRTVKPMTSGRDSNPTTMRRRRHLVERLQDTDPTLDPLVADVWAEAVHPLAALSRFLPKAQPTPDETELLLREVARRRAQQDTRALASAHPRVAELAHNADENHRRLLATDCWQNDHGGIRTTDADLLYESIHDDAITLARIGEHACDTDLYADVVGRSDALARLAERARQVDHELELNDATAHSRARYGDSEQLISSTDMWIDASWITEEGNQQ